MLPWRGPISRFLDTAVPEFRAEGLKAGATFVVGIAGLALGPVGNFLLGLVTTFLYDEVTKDREKMLELAEEDMNTVYEQVLARLRAIPEHTLSAAKKELIARQIARFPMQARNQLDYEPHKDERTLPRNLVLDREEFIANLLAPRISTLKPGDRMPDGWVLESPVGMGGFGEVWKATRTIGGRQEEAALKFCVDELQVGVGHSKIDKKKVLQHERDLIRKVKANVKGEGIVALLDDRHINRDPPFLVYEFIRGANLRRTFAALVRAQDDKPRWWTVLRIMRNIAESLAPAHVVNVVHRDLKPANILVCADPSPTSDSGYRYFITDFGIGGVARQMARANPGRHVTATPTIERALRNFNSGIYAAPDERKGVQQAPDPRDDIYSLGVIMYQMLLGDFEAEVDGTWRRRVPPELPDGGLKLLDDCFAPARDDRPHNAAALAARITEVLLVDTLLDLSNDRLWAHIPAGSFQMGSNDPAAHPDETPHLVRITRPFYMLKHQVTQGEFFRIMGENPSCFSATRRGKLFGDTSDLPVERVTWHQAKTFCVKLNALATAHRCRFRFRLPTEAEWEFACWTGHPSAFSCGPKLDSRDANINGDYPYGPGAIIGNYAQRPMPANHRYPANPRGLFHMHGNCGEWCADWYHAEYYRHSPRDDPKGPGTGTERVVRGGSYSDHAEDCRSARRHKEKPEPGHCGIGFRIVAQEIT